jgi:CDP-diacylglycerol---serine O-phosphatidyltransferase
MEQNKSIFRHLPNTITCMNLLSGILAIMLVFEGKPVYASLLIGVAAVFDFSDGLCARLLKAYSPMGKELDSLADMVSFGVLPAVIVFHLMKQSLGIHTISSALDWKAFGALLVPFSIAVFSGLRLAKFNIDERQTESFVGLPTPANAIFIGSLPLILAFHPDPFFHHLILSPYFLIGLSLFMSFMLVAEYPMFSLKFKSLSFKKNLLRYIFIFISVLLIVLLHYVAVPVIILVFIVLSGVNNWIYKF